MRCGTIAWTRDTVREEPGSDCAVTACCGGARFCHLHAVLSVVLLPSAIQICGFIHSFLRKDNKVSYRGLFPLFSLYEYLGFISASLLPYLIACLANETHDSSNPKDACISSEAWLKEESPVSMGCRSADSAESFHVHGPILSPKSGFSDKFTRSVSRAPRFGSLSVSYAHLPSMASRRSKVAFLPNASQPCECPSQCKKEPG